MANVRFGLVGFGRFGRRHARAIANTEGAELTAIAVRSEQTRAAAAAAHPDSAIYADYPDMLGQERLDVIDAAVPTHLHAEVGRAALASGCHLFMEKPMATTLDQCRELNQLAAAHGLVLMVGFKRRVAHLWSRVKQRVDEGVVGRPQWAVFELWRQPYRLGAEGWRYDADRVGSWILEEPVHSFDKARWLFAALGEPESIYARANSRQHDPRLQDNFSAVLNFPQGAHAVVTQTLAGFGHHHGLKLTGTEGALWARWSGAADSDSQPVSSLQYLEGETVREEPLPEPTGELYELEQEMAAMVRSVREGEPTVATGLDGAWAVAISEAATRSIDAGEPVTLTSPE